MAARNALVLANRGLAHHLVLRMWAQGLLRRAGTIEDAEQVAMMGLMRAADLYDPRRGTVFSTCACWWIRSFLGRYVRSGGVIYVPHYTHFVKGNEALKRRISRAVNVQQLPKGTDDDWEPVAPEPILELEPDERAALYTALRTLPKRVRTIMNYRFGLHGWPVMNLREIAVVLGISHERVRQLENGALEKLRENLSPEAVGR